MTINHFYSAMYADDAYPFYHLNESATVEKATNPDEITDRKDAALIVWGGSDIDPSFYGHPESRTTFTGGRRDVIEWALMKRAIEVGIPIIGVCRGAQMACAAAGGFLIQDVTNHAGTGHRATTKEGMEFTVNSIHHQMMFAPETVDHELLAWSTAPRSAHYIFKDDKVFTPPADFVEPEFYFFPKIKAFAIQWHPEGMNHESDATKYILEKIRERLTT